MHIVSGLVIAVTNIDEVVKRRNKMEDQNEQMQNTVQESTDTEGKNISLGKFKDVNDLLNAYNSLQAEFTKRCQRLKELEGTDKSADKTTVPAMSVGNMEKDTTKDITDEDKSLILKSYLKSVMDSKQKAIVMDFNGAGVKTPVQKPKTIAEAGALAKNILN